MPRRQREGTEWIKNVKCQGGIGKGQYGGTVWLKEYGKIKKTENEGTKGIEVRERGERLKLFFFFFLFI